MKLKFFFSKIIVSLCFFYFHNISVYSQDQRVADSLAIIYQENQLEGTAKLELLRNLSFNEQADLKLALKYAEELIRLAKLEGDNLYVYRGYVQKGNSYILQGDLNFALESFIKSAEAAVKAQYTAGEGMAYVSVADTYSEIGNSNNAEIYYNQAIELLRKTEDTISLATALFNAGDEALINKRYDTALIYFEESDFLFKNAKYLIGIAYNKGNIGMVHAEKENNILAEENINAAISILEELEDYSPIAEYLIYMSDIYLKKKDWPTALGYAQRSLHLAKKYGLKKQISETNLKLSELFDQAGNPETSYKHYKDHITYRDSVKNIEVVQQMADQRTNYEVSQKQVEIDLAEQREKNQRNIAIATVIALILIGLLAIGLFRRNTFIRKTKMIIEEERDRSDNLLLNILPEETARELKEHGTVKAKKYDAVTVMFTDFQGFTSFSEKLSPEALVETVGFYFSKFDGIVEKHGLEKIKTIGDAYMCAGGLHGSEENHPQKMVLAATEMAQFVHDTKLDSTASTMNFDVRIGINTGPVVAGVVGTKKFAYDIWGDTVNVASRMESMSEPGRINISNSTFQHIKSEFECDYRGEIEAKNRGKIKMYFVNNPIGR